MICCNSSMKTVKSYGIISRRVAAAANKANAGVFNSAGLCVFRSGMRGSGRAGRKICGLEVYSP